VESALSAPSRTTSPCAPARQGMTVTPSASVASGVGAASVRAEPGGSRARVLNTNKTREKKYEILMEETERSGEKGKYERNELNEFDNND